VRRALVAALARGCRAVDAVAYRPLPVALPVRWRCGFARWSARLDEHWGTGVWPDAAGHPPLMLRCHACNRRPATRVVTAEEGWLRRHPVELCDWCELEPAAPDGSEDLARAVARARRRSVGFARRG
jgi:hypothetical protein